MEKINVKVPLWKIRMEQRRKLEQRLNIVGGKIYNSIGFSRCFRKR